MKLSEEAQALEAVLFVSDGPVSAENIKSVLEGMENSNIPSIVEEINEKLEGHALCIVEIAEGYQLRTKPEHVETIKRFHKLERSTRLSHAALEVLSIIAYKQPITRQEVEDIRGVDSSGVIGKLLDKTLIKTMGRKKVPGKPMTFGTTKKFLEYFGLVKLSDMPMLKEFPENFDEEITQPSLALDGIDEDSGEKDENDIQLEEEAAMIEPAEEDYDDLEDDEEEDSEHDDEEEDEEKEK
ncbi:MAG: SMC-Scp complex subunit ScpB [Nitrospinota bacterium]|nr:SMC-Scp complex subunit ScpB [Nitrospinota bacterium]